MGRGSIQKHLPVLAGLLAVVHLQGQTIYKTSPDWRSTDQHYATGGQFADLNNDGWPDLVVSNGNDMRREPLCVYINKKGILETSPSWISDDIDEHGHLAVGDVNKDGWLDVAVTVLVADGGRPGVKLYLNKHGTLSRTPDWISSNSFNAWHCAFGDPDRDGDLDLLVGSTDSYGSRRWPNFIFFNNNGVLESSPSWQTTDTLNLDHMEFCDVDDDGDQDVVAIGSGTSNWIYRNNKGVIRKVPDWHSTDSMTQFANTLALGDLTGDGRRDLIVSDNNQMPGGAGLFKLYAATGRSFTPTYSWSYDAGMVSAVALADLNNDGRLDMATGAWWDKVHIFLNTSSGLPATPTWDSTPSLVAEAIFFGDVNRDGLRTAKENKDIVTGKTKALHSLSEIKSAPRSLYYLDRQPIEKILRVVVDGKPLHSSSYCCNLVNSWISLKTPPAKSIVITYQHSVKLDMGITDWENNGNLIYYHQ